MKVIVTAVLILLTLSGCDRVELQARSILKNVNEITRLPFDDQMKLCKQRKVNYSGCMEDAGWIDKFPFGYVDKDSDSSFSSQSYKCGKINNMYTENYSMVEHMKCLEKSGWKNNNGLLTQ